MAKEWHPTKNQNITPSDVTSSSGKKFWWQCSYKHEWQALVSNRSANKTNCPYCTNQRVYELNCLATIKPDLIKEWHPTKNENLTPKDVTAHSSRKIWWVCSEKHEWLVSVDSRVGHNTNCPYCESRKVCNSNCLATIRPDLVKEWHSTKNSPLTPYDIMPHSSKLIWWKCCVNNHEWTATPNNRFNGSNCPHCFLAPRSLPEILIMFELKKFFDINPNNHKLYIDNKLYDADIIIQNLKIVIEYDGAYWHKDKGIVDHNKTENLTNSGWFVIRVRETPLEKITEYDLTYKGAFYRAAKYPKMKEIINKILAIIKTQFNLNIELENYLKLTDLVSKTEAQQYIQTYRLNKNRGQ